MSFNYIAVIMKFWFFFNTFACDHDGTRRTETSKMNKTLLFVFTFFDENTLVQERIFSTNIKYDHTLNTFLLIRAMEPPWTTFLKTWSCLLIGSLTYFTISMFLYEGSGPCLMTVVSTGSSASKYHGKKIQYTYSWYSSLRWLHNFCQSDVIIDNIFRWRWWRLSGKYCESHCIAEYHELILASKGSKLGSWVYPGQILTGMNLEHSLLRVAELRDVIRIVEWLWYQ